MADVVKPLHQIVLECEVPRLNQATQRERKAIDVYSVEGSFNAFDKALGTVSFYCIPHISNRRDYLPQTFNGRFFVVTDSGLALPQNVISHVRFLDETIGDAEENYLRSKILIRCGTRTTYYQPQTGYYLFHHFYKQFKDALGILYEQIESRFPALAEMDEFTHDIEDFEEQVSQPDMSLSAQDVYAKQIGFRRTVAGLLRKFRKQIKAAEGDKKLAEMMSAIEGMEAKQFFFEFAEQLVQIPPLALYSLNPEYPSLQNCLTEEWLEESLHGDDSIELTFPFRSYNFRPKDPTAIRDYPHVEKCVHPGTQAVQVVNPELFLRAGLFGWTITYLCKHHFSAYYLGEKHDQHVHYQQENSGVRVLDVEKPQQTRINVASVFPSKVHVRADLHRYFNLMARSFDWPDDLSRTIVATVPRTY